MHFLPRFSKVPKLFGRIWGDIIVFTSTKRKRLEARNFAVILIFSPLQHMKRPALQNKRVGVLRDFRKTGPRGSKSKHRKYAT